LTIDRPSVRRAGLSVLELARETGISYPRLYRACNGSPSNLTPAEAEAVRRELAAGLLRAELSGR
jgi:hypothetical protein